MLQQERWMYHSDEVFCSCDTRQSILRVHVRTVSIGYGITRCKMGGFDVTTTMLPRVVVFGTCWAQHGPRRSHAFMNMLRQHAGKRHIQNSSRDAYPCSPFQVPLQHLWCCRHLSDRRDILHQSQQRVTCFLVCCALTGHDQGHTLQACLQLQQ